MGRGGGRAKREIKCYTEVLRLGIGSFKSCVHKFQAFAPLRGTVESKARYPVYTLKSSRAASVFFIEKPKKKTNKN